MAPGIIRLCGPINRERRNILVQVPPREKLDVCWDVHVSVYSQVAEVVVMSRGQGYP